VRFSNLRRFLRPAAPSRRPTRQRLRLEQIEDRVTPAVAITFVDLPTTGVEGTAITVNATTDVALSSFDWTVNRDGSKFLTTNTSTPSLTFTPTDDGNYTITLRVVDPADQSTVTAEGASTIAVANVAPTVTLPADATIDEGGTLTASGSFTDPGSEDTWTATVDYGDGSEPLTLTGNSFNLSHTYATSGSFTVTVTVTDDDGGVGTDTMTVTAVNVPPTLAVDAPDMGVRGQPLPFTLDASDSPDDMEAGFTFTIDWGDGTTEEIPDGEAVTVATHAYSDVGTYTVTVTATDQDGGVSDEVTHTVEIKVAALIEDPLNPGDMLLAVGGTDGDDTIVINPSRGMKVLVGGESVGRFTGVDRIAVYGGDGDDNIVIAGAIRADAWVDGGAGDDRIKGGKGDDVLNGGEGNDNLNGGQGDDMVIGGAGLDRVNGGPGGDLLFGGTALVGEADLHDVQQLWLEGGNLNELRDLLTSEGDTPAVADDGEADELQGAAGRNWFLAGSGDALQGNTKRSIVDDISATSDDGGGNDDGDSGPGNSGNTPGNGGNGNAGNGKGGNGNAGGNGKGGGGKKK
jgi:PKD repeat protein